jgi:ribosomal protein S18 acetylase RimI-like enzyme
VVAVQLTRQYAWSACPAARLPGGAGREDRLRCRSRQAWQLSLGADLVGPGQPPANSSSTSAGPARPPWPGRSTSNCPAVASPLWPEFVAVRVHPREQPHWYLAFIGVDPARQGYGVGAALLRSRLRRCDEDALTAYLESSKLENVPLYQHFGFHASGTLGLPEGAPVVNTMWWPGDLRDDASPERA